MSTARSLLPLPLFVGFAIIIDLCIWVGIPPVLSPWTSVRFIAFFLLGLVLVTDSTCSLACWLVYFHPPTIPLYCIHLPGYPLSWTDWFELRGPCIFTCTSTRSSSYFGAPLQSLCDSGKHHSVNVQPSFPREIWGHPSQYQFNSHVQLMFNRMDDLQFIFAELVTQSSVLQTHSSRVMSYVVRSA